MARLLKRWWFWLGMLALLGIVGAGYLLLPVQASRISQANCDKIQIGWSVKEVEGLLDRYMFSVTENSGPIIADDQGRLVNFSTWSVWRDGDGNSIAVRFDQGGVYEKTFAASDLSLVERLKGRIERRIRALWP